MAIASSYVALNGNRWPFERLCQPKGPGTSGILAGCPTGGPGSSLGTAGRSVMVSGHRGSVWRDGGPFVWHQPSFFVQHGLDASELGVLSWMCVRSALVSFALTSFWA